MAANNNFGNNAFLNAQVQTRTQQQAEDSFSSAAMRFDNLSFGTSFGTGEKVFQLNEDRFCHTLILGRTGSGKTNLLRQMQREDVRNGAGCFILATQAEDALYPLACLPEDRIADAILLDFSNPEFLPRMNPLDIATLDRPSVNRAIDGAYRLIATDDSNIWPDSRCEHIVRNGLRLIMNSPYLYEHAITNLARVYVDQEYVHKLLAYCGNRYAYDQWIKSFPLNTSSVASNDTIACLLSKLNHIASDHTLAHVFGPGRSTVNMRDVVEHGKVLVAYVPEERIGSKAAHIICDSLIMQLKDAVINRGICEDDWRGINYSLYESSENEDLLDPFFIYADEFVKFATPDLVALLAEARKRRVGIVLSAQTLTHTRSMGSRSRVVSEIVDAILSNVGSTVCYTLGIRDTAILSEQLGISPESLMRQNRYRPVTRLYMNNQPTKPFELPVDLCPKPDNPSAPRSVARQHVLEGTWLKVKRSTSQGTFFRAIE